ncbi:MAG: NAD-dependent DNA ligase LigA [Lachnospiraceae bacterium]|nr:NAD-dependent DNA ligase LigA [Cuneatibacter sp.]MDD6455725.1 NAD-dependent DNA ligase LigA [Lachnospiraceae bacterium]
MEQLIQTLRAAARAYYQESRELMSNYEYDALYDELEQLEKKTGIVLAGSPTQRVGYEVVSELPKEEHPAPMLSLDKTKDVAALQSWLGVQPAILSWKLDGLTVVLTYESGHLAKAVTRGNGLVGEVVTANARTFVNVPSTIPYTGRLVLRGEAIIRYSDFERMNEEITDLDARYKNPRNLCAGSVRQLNSQVTAERSVRFYAFALVEADGIDFENSRLRQYDWLAEQGFDVVPHREVTAQTLPDEVQWFADAIADFDLPSDGLVLLMTDIAYGESLGRTAKFPRNSIAFKWADEQAETHLQYVEWSASRTGLINPVAVFDPVELEGTTVSRASVHNVSIVESLELGEGDTLMVYKANMIIPQISENLTRSGTLKIPDICPVCGGATEIRQSADVRVLYCTNPECQAKKIKSFTLFVSRDAMNIDGLSEMTLEKFIAAGFIHSFADLFRLETHKEAIVSMEGFGDKSYERLIQSTETARQTTLPRLLYALGIPGIGVANARMLVKAFDQDLDRIRHASVEELCEVEGIGSVLAEGIAAYFSDGEKMVQLDDLLQQVTIEKEAGSHTEQVFAGQTFVITGSLTQFENRSQLKAFLEERGGKVTGSVTKNTTCLINNDVNSSSSKNKKAKELGIPIRPEAEIVALAGGQE